MHFMVVAMCNGSNVKCFMYAICISELTAKLQHRKKIQKNIDEFEGNIMFFLEIPLTK